MSASEAVSSHSHPFATSRATSRIHSSRVGFAAITPAGHQLLDNAMLTARETCAELLRHAPQDQLDALTGVLGNIVGPGA
jgi:hypothetical protein